MTTGIWELNPKFQTLQTAATLSDLLTIILCLGLCTVWTQAVSPTFQRYMLPPSWRLRWARYRKCLCRFLRDPEVEGFEPSPCKQEQWKDIKQPSLGPWSTPKVISKWCSHPTHINPEDEVSMCLWNTSNSVHIHTVQGKSRTNINNKPLWNLKIGKLNNLIKHNKTNLLGNPVMLPWAQGQSWDTAQWHSCSRCYQGSWALLACPAEMRIQFTCNTFKLA